MSPLQSESLYFFKIASHSFSQLAQPMDARTTTRSSKQALPKLVPSALVKQHVAACGKSRCRLCSWHGMCSSGMKPKWLHLSMRGKQGVAAGCADCAGASVGGPWAEAQGVQGSPSCCATLRREGGHCNGTASLPSSATNGKGGCWCDTALALTTWVSGVPGLKQAEGWFDRSRR